MSDPKEPNLPSKGQFLVYPPEVEQYLIFPETGGLLTLNERAILNHAGKISHETAKDLAEAEYLKFHRKQIEQADKGEGDFDKAIKQWPPPPKRKKGGKK